MDERRSQLVQLGLQEFGARTYDEVSIDLIAQTAGISKGLLYHYFPTKRAFYLACVREAAARLVDRVGAVPTDGPPLERLTAGLDAYLEHVRAHGRAFVMLMRGGGGGVDREITDVVDETRSHLLDQLTSGLGMLLPGSDEAVLGSPLLKVALTGWIGLAEAASIAWVEACVDDETSAPSQAEVREVLASALVGIVQSVVTRAAG